MLNSQKMNQDALPNRQQSPSSWTRPTFAYPATPIAASYERVIVEIGPGRGDFLFYLARGNPTAAIVGIEIKARRTDLLIERIEKQGLKNIWLVQDDARHALPTLFAKDSIDEIHINFPDPWPKRRHGKNRAASHSFLEDCLDRLKKNGTIEIATDHASYARDIERALTKLTGFKNCYETPIVHDRPDAFPTFFAQKWQREGRQMNYMKYRKI